MAIGLTGRYAGGPAKVAVLSSALFGTVSGSAAANVVTTGAFTIPLMKRIGYEPEFAAAVEACSSTGGQIVPPVMGTAAFLMADYIGMPYKYIMLAAILPCILYYFSIFVAVHLRAKRKGLRGLEKSECPDVKKALKERGHLILPFVLVIYMICAGYSAVHSGFWGIVSTVAVAQLRKTTRMSFRDIIDALISGAKRSISVAVACACVGFIVGIVSLTGVGNVLGNYILILAGGKL
ncbi:TRAP transporter fused permease subunit, partial [Dysosmobacter sp.]|uniref:TRAP transporter permease n=1 Tax=Dysosmobacter sp. TaxID=2591382 RepID=UPI003076910F